MIGGAEGKGLDPGQEATTILAALSLSHLEQELKDYITERVRSYVPAAFQAARSDLSWFEIDRNGLVLVTFVQDDDTHEILQAQVMKLR